LKSKRRAKKRLKWRKKETRILKKNFQIKRMTIINLRNCNLKVKLKYIDDN
jgi:hypothetical protein